MERLEANNPVKCAEVTKSLLLNDLYFMLRYGLKRKDVENQWILDRCREIQKNPDGYLDLWARGHYKSTIGTFALTIQRILKEPEKVRCIFSFVRPIAKAFLKQIKVEFETNEELKALFPEVLYADPAKQAPTWSLDDGIVVKREGNPKESTLEASGLVDGATTSKHFDDLIYDDVVDKKSVNTPDMIKKTTEAFELSLNLDTPGASKRMYGTRYHFNDTYAKLLKRGTVVLRLHMATDNGEANGNPVLLTREEIATKRRDMGPYTFACQMSQNPVADEVAGFKDAWLRYYPGNVTGKKMNKYILVDPASAKKKGSDYTTMTVIGLGPDKKYYILDWIRNRLSLTQRGERLFYFHRKWGPKAVGYEAYGHDADIEYMKTLMGEEEYNFTITRLGGPMKKTDRIRRLIPIFEQGRVLLPETCNRTNYEGKVDDLVQVFIEEEFKAFPVSLHDDMLDGMARMRDKDFVQLMRWPKAVPVGTRPQGRGRKLGWMGG